MPAGKHKSRSLRRVFVKTPGGKTVLHYRKRTPNAAHCYKCGAQLPGIPRLRPAKMKNLAKTKKRPERPYGGVLCTRCSKAMFKEKAKSL